MPSSSPFLFPLINAENSTLALRPLLIAGMVQPIVDGDGGVNIQVVTEHEDGILCLINPYLGMVAGDKHVIYWETQAIFEKTVDTDEVNRPLYFHLPTAHLQPGWVEKCFYQLTRGGEALPDDPSVPLRLLIKLNRPGGRDKEPHLPDGHSELKIAQLPPDLIEQGVIDADWAKKGVPVTIPFYPDIALRDAILLRWGSFALPPHVVTQAQADKTQPIIITVDQDAILAGGDSDALEIKYDVHDEVWNWATRHSKRTRIAVYAGAWRLEAPMIKEANNGIITIKDLNKQPVTVQVDVVGTDFATGDTLVVTWIGTPFTGRPLVHTETRIIDSIPSIVEIKVPYEDVRAIAMGRADASYVLRKTTGGPPLSSKRTFADVVGAVVMLPEPAIRELIGDTLEPDSPVATVDVRYPGMANGDFINLIWRGTRADGSPYPHEQEHTITRDEAVSGLITFYVESGHIKVLENGGLDLTYRVSNDQVALYGVSESERLLVGVRTISATLPAPKVPEASNGVLDPEAVIDKVTVLVDFPGTHKGDILTYYWRGPDASTSDWIPITSLLVGKPVRFRIDAQYVHANIGQSIKVRYTLLRAATNQFEYSTTLDLLVGEQVGILPAPTVIQAPGGTLNPMNALQGVDVSYPSMKPNQDIIRLKWLGTPGAGTSDNLQLPGDASGTVAFHLPPTLVAANLAQRVRVEYEVKRHSRPTPSQTLDLMVSGFLVTPVITEVSDSQGQVPEGGSTFDRQVTVKGSATRGEKVALFDGTLPLGTAEVTDSGIWSKLLSGLEVKSYQIIASALYDADPVASKPRGFSVAQSVAPTIANVTDSKGTVVHGGATFDRSVTVTGKASPNQKIRLLDGSVSLGESNTNASGDWSQVVTGLNVKGYSLTALALYDDGAESAARTFTVESTEENFDKIPEQTIGAGAIIDTPLMMIKLLTAQATLSVMALSKVVTPYPKPEPQPGKMQSNVLFLNPAAGVQSTVRMEFKAVFSKVSFWYNQTKSSTTVYFYNNDQLLGSKAFTQSESPSTLQSFEGAYKGITVIEILGNNDAYLLDHFNCEP